MVEDHYELLGVSPDADEETITAAYNDLLEELKEEQPDDVEARFDRVKRAHDVLTDAERRAAYDRRRERAGPEPETTESRDLFPAALGVDGRLLVVALALLLLLVAGEAAYIVMQSQRVASLEQRAAASEQRAAALEENLSAVRSTLASTRKELEETRRINQEYNTIANRLEQRIRDYTALYSRCDRAQTCSTLGIDEPNLNSSG